MSAPHNLNFAQQRSGRPDQVGEQQLLARLRAQLAVPDRPVAAHVVDVAGQRRTVAFRPQPGPGPSLPHPYGPPIHQSPQHPYPHVGQPHPGPPGYAPHWGHLAAPGYGYPPAPAGYRPAPRQAKTALIVAIITVLVLGLGIGGFFGVRAVTNEGSGEIFTPTHKTYSVEIPKGMVQTRKLPLPPPIPSETDLHLELRGKVGDGGAIQTSIVSGALATQTYEEAGSWYAQRTKNQYEGDSEKWGTGAKVDRTLTKIGGRDAVEINGRYSAIGHGIDDPADEPVRFFRVYFVDAPSGAPILIECDWNTRHGTETIEDACGKLAASFKFTG